MRTVYYLVALVVASAFLEMFANFEKAHAGGPWHDQYCDIEHTQIRVVDQQGNVIETKIEEKVVCQDGVKDFLHGMGIAENCQMFTWNMPLGETMVKQRQVACQKLNGEYEIVQGYHSID
mgnify:CR=1 FL=1